MTKIDELLREVQHVKAFLSSAEAALSSPHGDADAKADAASVGIEEAHAGFGNLLKVLAECRGEAPRGPTIEDIRQVGLKRHAEDQARSGR